MKNPERPAWGPSRRAPQASEPAPTEPQPPTPVPSEAPRRAKGSSRGYNPYDTVNTRLPDVWHGKPKRS